MRIVDTRMEDVNELVQKVFSGLSPLVIEDVADEGERIVARSVTTECETEPLIRHSLAQVFNERGDGAVVRGGTAQISKNDRQPHLTLSDARQLLLDALAEYRTTHGHQPARIVVHKTSNFTQGKIDGFHEAADMRDIDHVDMLWIQRRGAPYLYRTGQLPPLRGTTVRLDARSMLLYTRGSVPHFRTYPGMYIPQPLLIRAASQGTDPLAASTDILALSKMNWNNAQLDERDPLTLRTAYRVGSILKHVPTNARIATRYACYM